MKLTKTQLKQIIQEELRNILSEAPWPWESTTEAWEEDPSVYQLNYPDQSLEKSQSYQLVHPDVQIAHPEARPKATRAFPPEAVRRRQLIKLGIGFEDESI